MKIVIDIPEEIMEYIQNNGCLSVVYNDEVVKAISNGTPLPKGHGRLKDADKIANYIEARMDNWKRYRNEYEAGRYESYDYAVDIIEEAPTVIDADMREEADNEQYKDRSKAEKS